MIERALSFIRKTCHYRLEKDTQGILELYLVFVTSNNYFRLFDSQINNFNGFSIADKPTLIFLLRLSTVKHPFELLI